MHMSLKWIGRAGLLSGLLVGNVLAQDMPAIGRAAPEIHYFKDNGDQPDEERVPFPQNYRGRVLVMYFWRTTSTESVRWLKDVADLCKRYEKQGVRLVGFTYEKKEKVDPVLTEGQVEINDRWYGPGTRSYQQACGAWMHPYVVIVDSFGKIAWRGHPAERLEERIEDVLAAAPPYGADSSWIESKLREANRALDTGDLGRAYTLANDVRLVTDCGSSEHEKATSMMDSIEEKARAWLTKAVDLEREGKIDEAARIVAEISARFAVRNKVLCPGDSRPQGNQPSGGSNAPRDIRTEAENEIGRMNADRKLKEAIRAAVKNARGALQNDLAADLIELKQYDDAAAIYKDVIKNFEETQAAEAAKRALKQWEEDPQLRAEVEAARKEKLARIWLALGEHYTRLKMMDRAREQYQKILDEAGDSQTARRAKQRLDEMKETASETP